VWVFNLRAFDLPLGLTQFIPQMGVYSQTRILSEECNPANPGKPTVHRKRKLCNWIPWSGNQLYWYIVLPTQPRKYPTFSLGHLHGLTGSMLDHRPLPHEFESRCGNIWRVFHLSLRFNTVGSCSDHLAYHVYKSGQHTH